MAGFDPEVLDRVLGGSAPSSGFDSVALDAVLAGDEWEDVTPILQRNRRTGKYRPKRKTAGPEAVTPQRVPGTMESIGGAAAEAVRGIPARVKEGILSMPEILALPMNALIPAGRQGRPQIQDPSDLYGEEGFVRDVRESVRQGREASRERLAAAGMGAPVASALLDTGSELAAAVADPTNLLPLGAAAKVAHGDDVLRAAGRALETPGQRALRQASGVADEALPAPSGRGLPEAVEAMGHAGSDVSPEAMARVARGDRYVRVTPGGEVRPIINDVGAVDVQVRPGEVKAVVSADGRILVEQGRPNGPQARALAALVAEPPAPRPAPASALDEAVDLADVEVDDEARRLLGMRPESELPPAVRTTSTKNAVTAAERAARELPEVEVEARRSLGTAWESAKARIDEDPELPRRTAQEIATKPRAATPEDNALLLHDRMRLQTDHRAALDAEDAALRAGDAKEIAAAKVRRVAIEAALDVNDQAARKAGYEWGIAGRARQMLIREDYSPARLLQRARAAAGGKAVDDKVRGRLIVVSRQLDEALAKVRAFEESAQERAATRALKREKVAVEREARRTGRRAGSRDLAAEFDSLRAEFLARSATPRAGLDPDLAALAWKMARNRVRAGAGTLEQVVDDVYAAVKDVADLEPRDIRDAIAEGGAPRAPRAPSAATDRLRRVREEARLVRILEAAENGSPIPTRGGKARRLPPPEIAALRAQVKEVLARNGIGPGSDEARLAALKKRLQAQIPGLEEQIRSGIAPPKTPRRPPPAFDTEATNLRAEVARLRREADEAIRKVELQNRSGLEKAIDWTVGWGRAIKLSSTVTLSKLTSSGLSRVFIFNPIREVLGAPLTKLPGEAGRLFRERAPIEGGFSAEAIAKSWARFFAKDTRAAMWGHLRRMEEDPLTLAHGGASYLEGPSHNLGKVPRWMEYPGHVHAALEDVPVKYATYEMAIRKQAKFQRAMEQQGGEILARGGDLTDPLEQLNAEARAFEYATRNVFMQDDPLVKAFRRATARHGDEGALKKLGKGFVESQIPIVKVPVNIFKERAEYMTGLPTGIVRLISALRKGVDNVPYEEGDAIARQLKNGTFGLGLAWLGWSAADKLGGYWTGQRPKKGDPHEGEIELFGVTIPRALADHPAVMQLQFFATMRKMADRYSKGALTDGAGLSEGAARGAEAAALGTVKNVPFVDVPVEAVEALQNSARGKATRGVQGAAGAYLRGMTLPPDVQRRARIQDQRGNQTPAQQVLQQIGLQRTEARKRRPEDIFWDEIMVGIPGLREKVR